MKVNTKKIPEKYKMLVKENMSYGEINQFGNIILKEKIANIKNKLFGWYYARQIKKKNRKKI